MAKTADRTPPRILVAFLTLGLTAAALTAGCLGELMANDNAEPEAVLNADKTSAFVGESFEFDARNSTDSDGNITSLRLDFGDGTVKEFNRSEDAVVKYSYAKPGEYTVTLTVLDSGGEDGPEADNAQLVVAVNDQVPVNAQVAAAAPPGTNVSTSANQTFNVSEGAERYEINLTLTSLLPAGGSQIEIRVVDPNGTALKTETVSVDPSGNRTVELQGDLATLGLYSLQLRAIQGGASVTGDIVVWYGEEPEA